MRKIELDELKQLQLQILDEVVAFCNKHQIKYFLMAGTLLGAVRHQGYIPWDDDIDIGMLREDYERFLELYSKEQGEYYLYGYEVDKKHYYPFLKCCLKKTLMCEGLDKSYKYGVNIDIFPIDAISSQKASSLLKKIEQVKRIYRLKNTSMVLDSQKQSVKRILKNLVKKLLSVTPASFPFNIIYFLLNQEKINTPIKKGNIIWGYGEVELVNPTIFDEMILLPFEGKQYSVPKKYDEWLTAIYGDYMKLPPIERRVTHHNFTAYIIES